MSQLEQSKRDYYKRHEGFKVFIAHPQVNIEVTDKKFKSHKPIVMGKTKRSLLKKCEEKLLKNYPATLLGSTGAGRTETLLSLGAQYINNDEGLVYMDLKADQSVYTKIFSQCMQNNRLKDLVCINLMPKYFEDEQVLSHSLDLINPIIEKENTCFFQELMGKEIGKLFIEIALEAKSRKMLLDSSHMKSILILENLENWSQTKIWGEKVTLEIKKYLSSIGCGCLIKDINQNDFKKICNNHHEKSQKTLELIKILKHYEDLNILSKEPEVDIEDVFLSKKVLVCLLPALHKAPETYLNLSQLLFFNLLNMAKKLHEKYYHVSHLQNIIVDEANYCAMPNMTEKFFSDLRPSTNWIFGFYDYYDKEIFIDNALKSSKTIINMKSNSPDFLPNHIISKMFGHVKDLQANLFYRQPYLLTNGLNSGESYTYIEDTQKSEFIYLKMFYNNFKKPDAVFLNKTDRIKKIEKELSDLI